MSYKSKAYLRFEKKIGKKKANFKHLPKKLSKKTKAALKFAK